MATDWRTAKVCSKCGVHCMECKKRGCDCENHAGASMYQYKQQVGIDQQIIGITESVMTYTMKCTRCGELITFNEVTNRWQEATGLLRDVCSAAEEGQDARHSPHVVRNATEEELKTQREGWAKSCVTTDGPFGKYRDYDAPKPDMVNQPPHYRAGDTYETIRVIEAWDLGFNLGNTVKYISRAGRKDKAKTVEDLKKAAWYLQREISNLESAPLCDKVSNVSVDNDGVVHRTEVVGDISGWSNKTPNQICDDINAILEIAKLKEEVAVLRRAQKEEVWYWQGDGSDFPDSLTCPVIMRPDTLRDMLATIEKLRAAVEEWYCPRCNTIYPGPPADGLAAVRCVKCDAVAMPRAMAALVIVDNLKRDLDKIIENAKREEVRSTAKPHKSARVEYALDLVATKIRSILQGETK